MLIAAYSDAGMAPVSEDPSEWVRERFDAVIRMADKLVLAVGTADEVTLTVTTPNGVIHASATFPVSPMGLAMFVGAATFAAADTHTVR
jgi:hypothetical protein